MDICSKSDCTACGACVNSCSQKCISWIKDDVDTIYPQVDEEGCVHCNACLRACPNNNKLEYNRPFKTYAAWSLDPENRRTSASGGVASEFYRYTLKRGGFTCGVELTLDKGVNYIPVTCEEDIKRVKNSKYVFSHTNDIYQQVRQALLKGRFVFFIGLPCQIAGLKSFLGKLANNDNLLLADILCHGVSNEDYLFKYIKHIERKSNKVTKELSFRDPEYGTEGFFFTLRSSKQYYSHFNSHIESKSEPFYKKNHYDNNLYYIGYMSELIYRDNCYHCHYARTDRISDLTFGDFDGLGKDVPFNHWNKQVSMCLVNTAKGDYYLFEIANRLFLEERALEEAIKPQRQLKAPSKGHPNREIFIDYYRQTRDFVVAARRSLKKELRYNAIQNLKKKVVMKPILRITSKEQRERIKKLLKK